MIATQPPRPMKRAIRHRENTYYALEDVYNGALHVCTLVHRFPTMDARDAWVCEDIKRREAVYHSHPRVRQFLRDWSK